MVACIGPALCRVCGQGHTIVAPCLACCRTLPSGVAVQTCRIPKKPAVAAPSGNHCTLGQLRADAAVSAGGCHLEEGDTRACCLQLTGVPAHTRGQSAACFPLGEPRTKLYPAGGWADYYSCQAGMSQGLLRVVWLCAPSTTLHAPMQSVWVTVVWLPPLAAEPRSVCAARLTVEHTTRIQSTALHRLQQVARSWAPCMCAGTLCVLVCCVLQTLCAVCSVACAVLVGSQLTHPCEGFDRRCCGAANLTCSTDSCSAGCGALTGW